jgi:hypothetical protein
LLASVAEVNPLCSSTSALPIFVQASPCSSAVPGSMSSLTIDLSAVWS